MAIPRRRAMTVMIRPVVAAAMTLVRRPRWMMGRRTVMAVVAAGKQSAHCEKGDSSCKLLSILPCEHVNPSCLLNQPILLGCIIPKGNWKMLSAGLKCHKICKSLSVPLCFLISLYKKAGKTPPDGFIGENLLPRFPILTDVPAFACFFRGFVHAGEGLLDAFAVMGVVHCVVGTDA